MTALGLLSNSYAKEVKHLNNLNIKKLSADLSLNYKEQTGEKEKFNLFTTKILFDTNVNLNQLIDITAKAGFKYETGSTQATNDDKRYTPNSKLIYDHITIDLKPLKFVKLQGGAIDNSQFYAPGSVVNNGVSNLGLRESLFIDKKYFTLYLLADQSRPYNDQLSARVDSVEEGTPNFFRETAYLKGKKSFLEEQLKLSAFYKYTSFAYESLSSSVAFNDRFYGNSITIGDETNSFYNYSFKGDVTTYGAKINLKGTYFKFEHERTVNNNAPTGNNKADVKLLGIGTILYSHQIDLSFVNFENQRDTAPAYYSNSMFKNNYDGNLFKLKVTDSKGTSLELKYINRYEIQPLSELADEKRVSFALRKLYDFI